MAGTAHLVNDGVASAAAIRQGAFNVDSSGQATYRIEIAVPPGIAGLSPQLALTYNHRGTNGPLGIGWSIEGVSSIARVGANYATDGYKGAINFDTTDRLALDGHRLVNVSGDYWQGAATYATEVQRWVKVVAGESDSDGFDVVAKNGEIHEYGKTPDSRVCRNDDGVTVRLWALNAIQDLNGNRIEYSYTQHPVPALPAGGSYYLQKIAYTTRADGAGSANRFVIFSYVERDDKIVSYLGGGRIEVDCLLDTVTTYLGEAGNADDAVTTYRLNYETSSATRLSRLASVSVSGASAEGSPALPDIKLGWQDVPNPSIDGNQPDATLGRGKILSMDVNGDGLTDVVQFFDDAKTGCLCVDTFLASYSNGQVAFAVQPTSNLQTVYPKSRKLFASDVDGDGRSDLVVVYPDRSKGNRLSIDIAKSTGDGFSVPQTISTDNAFSDTDLFFVVDLNGDGRADIVQATRDTRSQTLRLNCYITPADSADQYFSYAVSVATDLPFPADSASLFAADVNGDGMTDLVLLARDAKTSQTRVYCLISTLAPRTNFVPFNLVSDGDLLDVPFGLMGVMLPADPNGDGLTDIVRIYTDSDGWMRFQTYLSDGLGHFTAGAVSPGYTPCANLFPMGFFGGASSDILGCSTDNVSGNWNFVIYSASPAGDFREAATVQTDQKVPQLSFFIGDVTGSGKADFLYAYLDASDRVTIRPYLSNGSYPDLVSSIEDQLGGMVSITYQPLTNSAVYSAGQNTIFPQSPARRYTNHLSPAQFPILSVIGQAVYVVSAYTLSNAVDRNRYPYSFGYVLSYTDALIDLLGRGWQGFRQMCVLDTSTQLLTRTVFNQDFPFTGQIAAIGTETGGARLELTLMTYLSRPSSNYPLPNTIEVLPTGTLSYTYTADRFDYVTAKIFADVQSDNILYYDAYGNNLREAWYGYVDYIDPAGIMSPDRAHPQGNPILPALLNPVQPGEMIYRYRDFVNDPSAWVLGLPAHEKASLNATDADIAVFNEGDLTLAATTYFPASYNRQSAANWDSDNQCFLATRYDYDLFGNCVAETLPGDRTTHYVFEATYNTYLDQTISPENVQGVALVGYTGYDPRFGIRVAEQDPNGFIFLTALDGFGRITAKQGPVPQGTQPDANGVTGLVTGTMHDRYVAAQVVSLETVAYQDDGQQGLYARRALLQRFPDDNTRSCVSELRYVDGLGRERLAALGTGDADHLRYSATTTDYTAAGKVQRKGVPFFCSDLVSAAPALYAQYDYDPLDRAVLAVVPGGENGELHITTSRAYGEAGLVTETQAVGAAEQYVQTFTHHWFNGQDCVVETAVASDGGAVTSFQFDQLARNWQSIDPNGVHNVLTYDSLGRKTALDNPDQNTTGVPPAIRYRYDPVTGLMASQTDASQAVTHYDYDLLGRLLATTFQDGRKFLYSYDTAANGVGRLAGVTIMQDESVESERAFGYDAFGNVSQESLTISGGDEAFIVRSVYDPVKRLVTQIMPDQSVMQRVYTDGLLSSQSLDNVQVSYSAFTPGGTYTGMNFGNGAVFAYQLNPLDQLYGETLSVSDATLFSARYTYDELNQTLQIQEQQGGRTSTQSFGYAGKRLVSATIPGFDATSYHYDSGGNLQTRNAAQYSYDAHFPTRVEIAGSAVYSATRDACGRTNSRTTGEQTVGFDYDGLGCLRQVTDAGGNPVLQMVSDDNGLRVKQTDADGVVTFTINDRYQVIKTGETTTIRKTLVDSVGALASIVTRPNATEVLYLRRDRKGSVTHCLDASGILQSQIAYDAFGRINLVYGALPDVPLYESRRWDGTIGLYYFGARYYDPVLGTFLTPDTRLGGSSTLQSNVWNRFAFELNNPLNNIDRDGHAAWWIAGLVIGLTLIAAAVVVVVTAGAATGAAAVVVGIVVGGLVGGGAAAIGYSAVHRSDFSWKNFGIEVGISAGIGMLAGGLAAGISGPIAASAHPIIYGAVSGALIGGASSAATSSLTSVAEGESVNGSAVGISAAVGFGFGAVGGAIGGKIGAKVGPRMNQVDTNVALAERVGGRYNGAAQNIVREGGSGPPSIKLAWQTFSPREIATGRQYLIWGSLLANLALPGIQQYVDQKANGTA